MTDLRKAAEMALDALLTCDVDYDYDENPYNTFDAEDVSEAIDALRQALAQPEHPLDKKADNARELGLDYEPEPFEYWNAVEGWVKVDEIRKHFDSVGCGTIYKTAGEGRKPLYTAPPKPWVGLTDDEILSAAEEVPITCIRQRDYDLHFAPIIEAKLKEKNNAI